MVNICSVYNCRNNSSKNPKLSFFLIPADNSRQIIWLARIGRSEWFTKKPEDIHKKRVCGEHFSNEMISGSRLKKDAFPNIFKDGIGEKGVNVNASSSASSSSMDIGYKVADDECSEDPINTNICATPEKKPEATQTSPRLSAGTPRKKKLQYEVKNLKKRIVSIPEEKKMGDEDFFRFCRDNFNPSMADFMISQLQLQRRKPRGHRYSSSYKQFALTIYFLGPKVYKFLEKTFILPHKATLCRITTNWDFSVGLNEYIFHLISLKTKNMNSAAKDCIICVDEMSIKTHLFYNRSLDQIIGFHQCNGSRSFEPANSALVVMARGTQCNWKQPVAYFFVHNSCKVEYLNEIITTSVRKLRHIGLNVLALVSDQGSNFYKFCKETGVTVDEPYFNIDEKKIFYIFDTPHLLKSTRNNLFKYDFKLGEKVIRKEYIEKLYKYDLGRINRLVHRITDIHINPNQFQKMKVSLAAQILSNSVALGIETLVSFNFLPADAIYTAEFVGDMDKLFDILNSSNFKSSKILNRPYQGSAEQRKHLLKSLSIFENLKVFNGETDITNRYIRFIKGWRQTIRAVLLLWEDLNPRVKFICTRFINQDALENFFGNIRSQGGNSTNPTPIQFQRFFKKNFCLQFFKHVEGGNCIRDLSEVLIDFNDLATKETSENVSFIPEKNIFSEVLSVDPKDYNDIELPEKNVLSYVCGYLIKKCLNGHKCHQCEDYARSQTNLSNETIYCHLRNFKEGELFGNLKMPPHSFYEFVNSLDNIFISSFPKISIQNKVGMKLKEEMEKQSSLFQHPCTEFPFNYLLSLFVRLRIYYCLKFVNKNFSTQKTNRKQKKMIHLLNL